MKEITFSIEINAKPETIWFVLWDDLHYRRWTSVFCEGSYMISDWKEGEKVHFLTPDGKGMYSLLVSNKPQKEMFFQHIGDIENFTEVPLDEDSKKWSGAREQYKLKDLGEKCLLSASIDLDEQHSDYFTETFPKALQTIKDLSENFKIVVQTIIDAPLTKVWDYYTQPTHILGWNAASDDWHTTKAENNLVAGGNFCYRMEAKDGSFGFDFEGTFTKIEMHSNLEILLGDGRKMELNFSFENNKTMVRESFQVENENSLELQQNGWQAILNNFKKYSESN